VDSVKKRVLCECMRPELGVGKGHTNPTRGLPVLSAVFPDTDAATAFERETLSRKSCDIMGTTTGMYSGRTEAVSLVPRL
jgi:hypothetical protein